MQSFSDWLGSPYSEGMSAARWFLFVGLLIAISVLWGIILRHVRLGT